MILIVALLKEEEVRSIDLNKTEHVQTSKLWAKTVIALQTEKLFGPFFMDFGNDNSFSAILSVFTF